VASPKRKGVTNKRKELLNKKISNIIANSKITEEENAENEKDEINRNGEHGYRNLEYPNHEMDNSIMKLDHVENI
jgi:hypothetical protein